MFKWLANKFRKAPKQNELTTLEQLEAAVDDVNFFWAKLEEEGNPDRVTPWMLWGKDRQLCLQSHKIDREVVYHSPMTPGSIAARLYREGKPSKREA